MLDIQVFKPVPLLLFLKLVVQCFLQVDSLNVEDGNEAVIVALVAHNVKHVPVLIVHVHLLVDHVARGAHVCHQIEHDILVA